MDQYQHYEGILCFVNIFFSFAAIYPPLKVSASPWCTYSSVSKMAFLSSSFYFSNIRGVQVGPLWRLSWPVKYWFFCCSNWSSDFSRHLPVELALHTVSDLGDLPGLSLSSEEWWDINDQECNVLFWKRINVFQLRARSYLNRFSWVSSVFYWKPAVTQKASICVNMWHV